MNYKIKKNITILVILCTLCLSNSFAISPNGKVTDIGQSSDVGDHIYPVSVSVNYSVYDFPIMKGKPLRFTVALSGGYGTHSISQKAENGEKGWDNGSITSPDGSKPKTIRSYGIIFSTYSFKLSQAFPVPFDLPGSLNSYYSLDCRYERPVTLASYFGSIKTGSSSETAFTDDKGNLLPVFASGDDLVGTPELNGNMYLKSFSFHTGLSYSFNINDYHYSISNAAIFAPQLGVINAGGSDYGGESEYFKLTTSLSVKKDIYGMKYNAPGVGANARLFNIYFRNSTSYIYLKGDKVPMFIQSNSNYRHGVSNTLSLNIDGPQFLTGDTYPSAYIQYVDNFKWGLLNNCNTGYKNPSTSIFSHYYKAYFDMRVIGIIHFSTYYQWNLEQDSLFRGKGRFEKFWFWVNI